MTQSTLSKSSADLFTPLKLGAIPLSNRVLMAPLTRNRAGEGNVPTDLNVTYYAQRASAGLIITEASQVSPEGVGYPATPGIHTPAQVAGWKKVTQAVHEKGGRMVLQLWHVGRISHPSMQPEGGLPVAPSAIQPEGEAITYEGMQPFVTPRALALEELPGIVSQYRRAAQNARLAGFDGVEIHAANGYLLDQFLRDGSNHRSDAYGGTVANRTRLLLEVVEAVTEVWPAERVGVRISPINRFNDIVDSNPASTFTQVARALSGRGLMYLHVVEGDFLSGDTTVPFDWAAIKTAFAGPYIANGGYDGQRANARIAAGEVDAVAFGKLFIANPDLPARLAADGPLTPPDEATFYGGDATGYTDYPFSD